MHCHMSMCLCVKAEHTSFTHSSDIHVRIFILKKRPVMFTYSVCLCATTQFWLLPSSSQFFLFGMMFSQMKYISFIIRYTFTWVSLEIFASPTLLLWASLILLQRNPKSQTDHLWRQWLRVDCEAVRRKGITTECLLFVYCWGRSVYSQFESPAHRSTHLHRLIDELNCRCFPCFGNGSQSGVPIAMATSIEEQITVGD